jgi:AraC family transcriptional regulator, regulatory protein of adaptative response / methylated-DNA-[protein]-cysteine methyltransferase
MSPAHFQRAVFAMGRRLAQALSAIPDARPRRRCWPSGSPRSEPRSVGLSGAGRLHDLFLRWEAMSPGDYARGGEGLVIRWGWFDSPFGPALVMGTDRASAASASRQRQGPRRPWPTSAPLAQGAIREDEADCAPWADAAFATDGTAQTPSAPHRRPLPDQGLGGADAHPLRPCHHLFEIAGAIGNAQGGARRGHGRRAQPDQLAHPLPPRLAQIRGFGRLSLGPAGQTRDARLGIRPAGADPIQPDAALV